MSTQVMSAFEDLEKELIEDRKNLPDGVTMSVEAVMNSFIDKYSPNITSSRQFKVTTTYQAPNNGDMPQDFIPKIYTSVIKGVLNNAKAINSINNLPAVINQIHQAVEGVLNNTQWNNSSPEVVEVVLQEAVQNAISSVTGLPADEVVSDSTTTEVSTNNAPASEGNAGEVLVNDALSLGGEVTESGTSSGEGALDGALAA